jgi:hypothetical protein
VSPAAARRYFRVGPSFWHDHAWNDDERLAALYILTCEHRTTEGLFRLPLVYAATDLGWTARRFRKAFDRLLADEFIEYDPRAQVCLIVKALKWQPAMNPNMCAGAVKRLEGLPSTYLLARLLGRARQFAEPFAKALEDEFAEEFAQGFAHAQTRSTKHEAQAHKGPTSLRVLSQGGDEDVQGTKPRDAA